MSDEQADQNSSHARDYEQGQVLFREGDPGKCMYVIQAGAVAIQRTVNDQVQTLAALGPGEFFGEMAIVNDRPRSATALIIEKSTLLEIGPDTFETMLAARPEIAIRMLKALAGRLERANQQVELLLLTEPNHRVVQCLRRLSERHENDGTGTIYIPEGLEEVANLVHCELGEVQEIIGKLANAGLVMDAQDAGIEAPGLVIPEVGRLLDFLEFLELKGRRPD